MATPVTSTPSSINAASASGPSASSQSTTALTTGSHGTTVIKDAVVAKVAGIAARSVAGVYDLGGGAARTMGAIRGAMNQSDLTQGIGVEVGETQVAVDVNLVAEYPVPLQTIADNVRTAVTDAVEGLVGMEITEVNVTINDVHLPTDDRDESAEARVQ